MQTSQILDLKIARSLCNAKCGTARSMSALGQVRTYIHLPHMVGVLSQVGMSLSLWEREEISRGIVARHSIRSMALLLLPVALDGEPGSSPQWRSMISAALAEWRARARRPKRCKLSSGMRRVVAMKLGLNHRSRSPDGSSERIQELGLIGVSETYRFVCSSPRCA